ncbi:MAG: cysteine peptidase family C39 domain-containing protein, partial [Planctomycetaceae bacterium]|nr:cysteine peptidase family C39 domain-containing protein [Planctomycetaceae bacterium]
MQRIPGGVLIGLALAPTLALADDLDAVRRMSICGPRCVQRVLEFYGQKEDLATLVREMQGGVVNEFSSFHGIEEALSRRGVHALPVQYGVLGFPNWREPVILHYREGHFVVLSETKGGFVKIHDGILHPPTWEPLPSVML